MGGGHVSIQRRRDPRLPGSGLEDVETVVDGQRVVSYELSDLDKLIATSHQDALDEKRVMWGLDRDDWLLAMEALQKEGHLEAAALISRRWCDIAIAARGHDSREPDWVGFQRLASIRRSQRDRAAELAILDEWLSYWPADRWRGDKERDRVVERRDRLKRRMEHA
jgi:hypothetical protein